MRKISWKLSAAVLLLILVVAVDVRTFLAHKDQIIAEDESIFANRAALVGKFADLNRDRVTAMSNVIINNYESKNSDSALKINIVPHKSHGYLEIIRKDAPQGAILTAAPSVRGSAELNCELHGVFAIDPQIDSSLKYDPDIAWIYYLSAQGFIYIAPHSEPDQFHFTPRLFARGFWQESSPAQDPARRMIVKGPYEDMAGKGWILTFAQPVYWQDKRIGLTAIDLRIGTLEKLISVGSSIGESMLISEHHRLFAKGSGFVPRLKIYPPLSNKMIDWHNDKAGDLWLSAPVVEGEMWLVHRIRYRELYLAAARESALVWVTSLLLALVAFMILRLRSALQQLERVTQVDPLTQVLNRRGFYHHAEALMAIARREESSLALLLMDIDFFKKINDTFGHQAGDQVLAELGANLRDAARATDLICRWGGEEFIAAFLIEQCEDAVVAAERFRMRAQRTRIGANDQPVTLSGGLALLAAGEALDDAIKRADACLYRAKEGGRNRIVADEAPVPDHATGG